MANNQQTAQGPPIELKQSLSGNPFKKIQTNFKSIYDYLSYILEATVMGFNTQRDDIEDLQDDVEGHMQNYLHPYIVRGQDIFTQTGADPTQIDVAIPDGLVAQEVILMYENLCDGVVGTLHGTLNTIPNYVQINAGDNGGVAFAEEDGNFFTDNGDGTVRIKNSAASGNPIFATAIGPPATTTYNYMIFCIAAPM